ncbi:MAG: radical SAM family heme chaperone HemW [Clostridia bacterium]|nr:radical SAM family heme chaperone HemW [Clostridia bacterium]
MLDRGLYIHIPFCAAKCAYCDFYSLAGNEKTSIQSDYVDALCRSAEIMSSEFSNTVFSSIYVGGGTPSILPFSLLEKLFASLRENFKISEAAEFTVEANPATLTEEKLRAMTEGGVNRLSLGCQSSNDNELRKLSRIHTFSEFCDSFNMARKAGISNISVDLMYGIPLQTTDSLLRSISDIARLSPEHISLYGLRVEPDTKFGRDRTLVLPSDDTQAEMYLSAVRYLAELGYERYEISNFAKDGHYSRHNMRYWECGEYLALGPAAHSFIDSVRYSYDRSINAYISAVREGHMPEYAECTLLTDEDRQEEYIFLSLRLEKGLSLDSFEKKFGSSAKEKLISLAKPYIPKFMVLDSGHLKFTSEGFLVSNTILSELI